MSVTQVLNGRQQFIDINGRPLVAGTVGMYIPSTLIPKNTWQDAGQTILNTNPIELDSRGQADIWGGGLYRQIVHDEAGNLIWDVVTSAAGGGIGPGGITRTITVADSPYTMQPTDGVILCDVSGGAITINLLAANAYGGALSVKIKGAVTNNVTIDASGADTIDGNTTFTLRFGNQAITLVSNLSNYWATI